MMSPPKKMVDGGGTYCFFPGCLAVCLSAMNLCLLFDISSSAWIFIILAQMFRILRQLAEPKGH